MIHTKDLISSIDLSSQNLEKEKIQLQCKNKNKQKYAYYIYYIYLHDVLTSKGPKVSDANFIHTRLVSRSPRETHGWF